MNKTVTVNIGGAIFNIEEDAYLKLKNYLDAIARHFTHHASKSEIMADIESRIAELLHERLSEQRRVVVLADIEAIQSIMGSPEDYADPDGAHEDQEATSHESRRFYRDTDDAAIGGVAAGLSHSLGWDPLWLRIVFVLLTFFGFAGIPIYIVLYLVIPPAKTTAEKLRMRREKVNVENISKTVNDGYENVKSKINSKKTRDGMEKLLSGLGSLFTLLANFLRVLVGLFLLIIGMGLAVGAIAATFGLTIGSGVPPMLTSGFLKSYVFLNDTLFYFTFVGALLFLAAPVFGLLYTGVRLLLNLRAPLKGVGLTLSLSFVVGAIMLATSAMFHASEHSRSEELNTSSELDLVTSDSLYVKVSDDLYWHSGFRSRNADELDRLKVDGDQLIFAHPGFRIRPAQGENFAIELSRTASGASVNASIEHAREITYKWQLEGNELSLPPYFTSPANLKFRGQKLRVTLLVPEGKTLVTGPDLDRIIRYDHGVEGLPSSELPGKSIRNTASRLEPVN